MKRFITFILVLSIYGGIYAQQIPNSSFENWTNTGPTLEPDNWLTVSFFTENYPTYGSLRTTDAYDGQYALLLKSGRFNLTPIGLPIIDTTAVAILGELDPSDPSNGSLGIPFTFRPGKLSFYYKYQLGTTPVGVVDTARVYVDFYKSGNRIGIGVFKIYGNAVNTYTYHAIDIDWYTSDTPDTMRLDIASSSPADILYHAESGSGINQIGNSFYIDKLLFDYGTGLNEQSNELTFDFYPNPANDVVAINNIPSGSTVKIIDFTGKVVYSLAVANTPATISTTDFANGIYLIQLENNGSVVNRKLVVRK